MASARGGVSFCAALNCTNSKPKGWRMFNFPVDPERYKKWVQNTRREDLRKRDTKYVARNCKLCSDHFDDGQFMNSTKQKLTWRAVPTIFDVPNPPPTASMKRRRLQKHEPQTKKRKSETEAVGLTNQDESPVSIPESQDRNATASTSTSGKKTISPTTSKLRLQLKNKTRSCQRLKKSNKKYRSKMRATENRSATIDRLTAELSQHLPKETLRFVTSQLRVGKQSAKGRRWSFEEKAMALSLLHASPKVYRMMRKILSFPSITTLRRSMQRVSIFPGFNDNILQALKEKLPDQASKLCVLVFDEMTLKEEATYNIEEDNIEGLEDFGDGVRTRYLANHATVFMVRGIVSQWKQTIGYFLSSGPIKSDMLQSLIFKALDKLSLMGLQVKVVICDQGSNNTKALAGLGVTEERPFFVHTKSTDEKETTDEEETTEEKKEQKIFVMYDPPHLLKNIRNNLKKNGFTRNGKSIRWSHVEELFLIDSKNAVRMAPKLTKKHIYLPAFAALRVKFATQVLSHTVAAGISTLITLGYLKDDPEGAKETALFIETFDTLLDAFNSRSKKSNKTMRHAFTANSKHKSFLLSTLDWLSTLKSNSSRKLPCMSGWIISIKSLLELWEDLHVHYEVQFLLTARLNQDCVENLFSVIRGKGGHGDSPSAKQFRQFLRMTMVDSIIDQSPTRNCKEDGGHFLLNLGAMTRADGENVSLSTGEVNTPTQTNDSSQTFPAITDAQTFISLAFNTSNLSSVVEQNVVTYIAGYLAKKLRDNKGRRKDKICVACRDSLTGEMDGTTKQTFIQHKQLEDSKGGLTIPSSMLVLAVEDMERVFQQSNEQMYMDKVRARFLLKMTGAVSNDSLACPVGVCDLKGLCVGLYLNIRLHFALTDSNRTTASASKRQNRKVLKFSHL